MPKEILTNIHSFINRSATGKVLLYDGKTNGCIETANQKVTLTDSIYDYDMIGVEIVARSSTDSTDRIYYINDQFIVSKYIFGTEPLTLKLTNYLNAAYQLTMMANNTGDIRVVVQFPTNNTFQLTAKTNYPKLVTGVRNIYGINFGISDSYSKTETKVGRWVNGEDIYRITLPDIDMTELSYTTDMSQYNIKEIIKFSGSASGEEQNGVVYNYCIPYIYPTQDDAYYIIPYYVKSKNILAVKRGSGFSNVKVNLSVDYIKK